MGVNKFNAEGYPAPTAFEAISNTLKDQKQQKAKHGKSRQRQRENRRLYGSGPGNRSNHNGSDSMSEMCATCKKHIICPAAFKKDCWCGNHESKEVSYK